jgi:prephenate dehydratase
MKIAYYGAPGSFSYLAMLKYFEGNQYQKLSLTTFEDIFEFVCNKKVDYGVVPLENSLAGTVYQNYDLMFEKEVKIVGEYYLPITLCLLTNDTKDILPEELDIRLNDVKVVYTHWKAFEQCKVFFNSHPWIKPELVQDTSNSALKVAEANSINVAAIASEEASQIYNLNILKKGIQDSTSNITRFVVIRSRFASVNAKVEEVVNVSYTQKEIDSGIKCSLCVHISHEPGSLYRVLEVLYQDQANLTKIESRPLRSSMFSYLFYLDFILGTRGLDILNDLEKITEKIRLLGCYRAQELS